MNDVTSMLYVSLVRQFEALLFYVVTSKQNRGICCIASPVFECLFRKSQPPVVATNCLLSFPPLYLNGITDFQSQSGAQFSVTHSGKILPDP